MLGKILVLSAFILVCSGCSTLSKTQEDKPVTAPPVSAFAANKPVFAPTYKSEEPDKYYDAIEIYDSSPKAPQGVYQHDGKEKCDGIVSIPMFGKINSLNASVACGIAVYEAVRQRNKC